MDFVDPYIDTTTGILRNLIGAKTHKELRDSEAQVVFANELELSAINIPRTNDTSELLKIHAQLFHGVYDWAGQIRTVDIKKNDNNSEYFLVVSKIKDAALYVFTELAKENNLHILYKSAFVGRLAYFYDQLNYIHPFRDGNGRTQRVFWSRVAEDAGYTIDWDSVIGNENDEASKLAAEELDRSALEAMLTRITSLK